jgi:hypothetical protein
MYSFRCLRIGSRGLNGFSRMRGYDNNETKGREICLCLIEQKSLCELFGALNICGQIVSCFFLSYSVPGADRANDEMQSNPMIEINDTTFFNGRRRPRQRIRWWYRTLTMQKYFNYSYLSKWMICGWIGSNLLSCSGNWCSGYFVSFIHWNECHFVQLRLGIEFAWLWRWSFF